ncbi:MAG: FliH/SctL family protein [Beijerinckiaceae bacterium]|jgi:flagellar assembly protein FliH|nr:FliH/SctL family protein [Beijerinckiaceae bacterium]
MTATRFTFETDFRQEAHGRRVSDVDVVTAREQGFQDGFAQGRQAAEAEAQAALKHMAGVLAAQAEALLGQQQARLDLIEASAAALAVTMARRLAGAALADKPAALIEQAARECIVHARSAPHLAVRVNEAAVEDAETLFGRLTRESGYAGKVIILGEPDIAPGDARFEWADGGVVIDRARLEQTIAAAAEQVLGKRPDDLLR